MGMFFEILGFLKALSKDLGNLLDPYPKKRKPFTRNPDDRLPVWGPDSYEPWDFLSEEQWKEILDGKKPLEAYTTSHAWPPHLKEEEPIEDKQEEGSDKVDEGIEQEQNEDSENAGSAENSESPVESGDVNSEANSVLEVFESQSFESGDSFESGGSNGDCDPGNDSGNYDGYIG
jgi:hypothetical protein